MRLNAIQVILYRSDCDGILEMEILENILNICLFNLIFFRFKILDISQQFAVSERGKKNNNIFIESDRREKVILCWMYKYITILIIHAITIILIHPLRIQSVLIEIKMRKSHKHT